MRRRGCEAGELQSVCVCGGGDWGRRKCGDLRICVKVTHRVVEGSVRVRTVWSAWGQTCFTLSECGHGCKAGTVNQGGGMCARALSMGMPRRLTTLASKESALQSDPGHTTWKGIRYYRLRVTSLKAPGLLLAW